MPTRRDTLALLSAAMAIPPELAFAQQQPREAIAPYIAACLQMRVLPTQMRDGTVRPENVQDNIARTIAAIEKCAGETGAKLLVFPEFALQLPQGRQTAAQWVNGALRVPGP